MQGTDGKEMPSTGKSFDVDFCTIARWDSEQIVEENQMTSTQDDSAQDT